MADQITVESEKTSVGVAATPINDDPKNLEENVPRPSRDLIAAIWAIICGVALPCIPILVVSAVLIGLIFRYRVIPRPGWPEFIVTSTAGSSHNVTSLIKEIKKEGGSAAYYVDFQPTSITTIAGWTGRIIPYLSSSIMALVAFYAARHIVLKSQDGNHDELPTPKQLSILINLLGGGGMGPLKDTVMYRFKNKEKLVAPLPAVLSALTLITLTGLLIPLVDTWFGVSVHSATITQLYNVSTSDYHSFGIQLNSSDDDKPNCLSGPMYPAGADGNSQTFDWPCNVEMPIPHPNDLFLIGGQAAAAVQLGLASNNTVMNYTGPVNTSSTETPSLNHPIYFVGDQRSSTTEDFRTETMGMTTQCSIITSKCYSGDNGTAFSCPGGFEGDFTMCEAGAWPANGSIVGSGPCKVGIGFAADAELSQPAGMVDMLGIIGTSVGSIQGLLEQNPMYFGAWSIGFPAFGDPNTPLTSDSTNVFPNGSSYANWLLNCSTTVYDVEYSWVNGALHNFTATPASGKWGAFFSAPFAWMYAAAGLNAAQMSLELAAYDSSYSAQNATDMADIWARKFSFYALSTSLGAFEPRLNSLEQVRNNTVSVARVPIAPLYLLLGLKWLYVVVVICMAIGVYCFTHPAETEVVKAQLSVKGLVTAHFDQPDMIHKKVLHEVETRLGQARELDATGETVLKPSATAAAEEVPSPELEHKPKVGLVPTREGTWKFALLVNGAWQSVKPIVKDTVLQQANAGKLGSLGNDYAAWK
ncbi:hypothetical protein BD289DRAFT_482101 [Coniella lustricola]|uniref:Uncharacterized protein n=1 Tax=Coniella lustricola TaxID=2025994 RepID=A0A2T3AA21_9PEZI|nr:hypothetical protein BD289DRAFT_482101 [Coniella lustricola]